MRVLTTILASALTALAAEEPSLAKMRAAAERGDARAQFHLADAYEWGRGVPKDDAESVKWLLRAAEKGLAEAQYRLGARYDIGSGVAKDDVEAARWYRRAAEQHYAPAQTSLGEQYVTGEGVPKDCTEAAKWLRLAAQQQDRSAAFYLGGLHLQGCGVPRDEAEALRWYRLAAEQWHIAAQHTLGSMLYAGRGAPRDVAQAIRWFRRAQSTRLADPPRMVAFGYHSRYPRSIHGTPPDDVLAYFWASLAAADGDAAGRKFLAELAPRLRPEQVAQAQELLALWRKPFEKTFEDWALELTAPDPEVAQEARNRLRQAGARAVPALTAALRGPAYSARVREAADELALMGSPARDAGPALEAQLAASPTAERAVLATALARVDPVRGKKVVPDLERCVIDRSWPSWRRQWCVWALDTIGAGAGASALVKALGDDDPELRADAAHALRAAPAATIRGPLQAKLADPVLKVRLRAATSLLHVLEPPASLMAVVVEGVCKGDEADASHIKFAMQADGEWARQAEDAFAAALRGADATCKAKLQQALEGVKAARSPGLPGHRAAELRLVAVIPRKDGNVAFVVNGAGSVWEVRQGQAVYDGAVERVTADGMEIAGRHARLFAGGAPPPLPAEPSHTGERLSIDFEGDLSSFAVLVAQASGLNVIVEAGAAGTVRIAARDAPWDAVVEQALKANGFGYKLERIYLRLARRDQVANIRPLSGKPSASLVSLQFRNADLLDLERLFEEILDIQIDLPPGPHERVTVFVQDMPGDEVLELIAASRGWILRADGKRFRAEVPRP